MAVITGVGVSAGRAAAPLVRMPDPVPEPSGEDRLPPDADPARESARIGEAAEEVRAELERRAEAADGERRAILEATALMAADPTLVDTAQQKVAEGWAPERAVWVAANDVAETLQSLGGYVGARARDIADVRDRIVAVLRGLPAPGVPQRSEPFVLVSRDLAPADTATLDPRTCVGVVTAEGGPTSHTAIIARALGLPAVVAARGVLDIPESTVVLVDGTAGTVEVDPPPEAVRRAVATARSWRLREPGRTADGRRVELLANVGNPAEAAEAADAGAEGVGLFRTEFCFLDRADEPTIEEQVQQYRAVLAPFRGTKVIVRTLDAGSDKPMPFLTPETETNPALGMRGYRTVVRHPDVLDRQLDAIARAAEGSGADVWVMAPMIATPGEARSFVATARDHGLAQAGAMVEIPAAALEADTLIEPCAFVSIGTNDLAQYTMAADRQLGELARLNDPWQAAVLRLVQLTASAGQRLGRPVGVCGEAAADPALAVVLVGLGVTSLSMTARALAGVAETLAAVSYDDCVRLAARALEAPDPGAAKELVQTGLH